ncbi:type III pantothenate kinase [Mariniflexile gromovii]|uniref:Type III pantothenate kinase n=1 Tax=Mariniflexile gromovii TaxID=362523 RepID=A0ABS4BZH8_9FLAO|nr:type III pantothenate kinase [Mariniflexile gromovii]MBP0905487.1 type III pantothenate kinase [Mariniflexile gromovii]
MNLIIDVGNSFVKLAVFNGNTMEHKEVVKLDLILERIRAIRHEFSAIKRAIVSSVGRLNEADVEIIGAYFDLLILNSNLKLPYKSLYKTPKTLGVDRIALVSASVNQFPNNNVLIIDAGTCITYDFITAENHYLGGAIAPGLRMRYKALHNFTANLPLLDTTLPNNIVGNSTETSIHSGVVYGVLKEIDGVIEDYKLKYSDLTVILTGGDSNFLSKQLKSSIFATSNFLLEGLNFILQFNSNE